MIPPCHGQTGKIICPCVGTASQRKCTSARHSCALAEYALSLSDPSLYLSGLDSKLASRVLSAMSELKAYKPKPL